MIRNYQYRILPNKKQVAFFHNCFGAVRFIYNQVLHDSIEYYNKTGKFYYYTFKKYREKFPWLSEVDSFCIAYARRNLSSAFMKFFRSKSGEGFPKFKSKKDDRNRTYTTFCAHPKAIYVKDGKLRLPKIGWVKIKLHRPIPKHAKIKNVTIKQIPSGEFYACILIDIPSECVEKPLDTRTAIGLDYSSPHCFVDSEGNEGIQEKFYRTSEDRIIREQKRFSNTKPGSRNREKQRLRLSRIWRKTKNRRIDWCHKVSREIATNHDIVCIENLNMQVVGKSLNLGKSSMDNGFGYLKKMLKYKLEEHGGRLVTIGKFFPSSKMCHECGFINEDMTLKTRKWECPNCHHIHNRDVNAALNIRDEGVMLLIRENQNRGVHGNSLLILDGFPSLSRKEPPHSEEALDHSMMSRHSA